MTPSVPPSPPKPPTPSVPPTRVVRESVGLYEAKTQLSALVDRAAQGEEIVITKSGKPMARLVPLVREKPVREPGKGKGQWFITDDWDDPLPDDIIDLFYQS